MKFNSMFLSVALLTTALTAQAMEEPTASVDLKAELQAHVLACDAEQFKATWQPYQTTAQVQDVATTQSTLIQLTTQLRAHKDQERTAKLSNKWSRRIAGLSGTLAGMLSAVGGIRWIYFVVIGDYKYNGHIQFITPLMGKKFGTLKYEVQTAAFLIGRTLLLGHFTAQGITYARFANTQQLSKDITALDEILACLNPQSPNLIDTEIIK
jgi:hypothetical protein